MDVDDSSRGLKRLSIIDSMEIEKILPKLLKLPSSERAELATQLIRSLDEAEDDDAEEAWAREIKKRAADIKSGRVKPISWAKARKRIEAKLRTRQG